MSENRLTRSQAIRAKCLKCCCGNRAEVRRCHIRDCPLWGYRMGSPSKAEKAEKPHVSGENSVPGYRYNNDLPTILSSELTFDRLLSLNEAIWNSQ